MAIGGAASLAVLTGVTAARPGRRRHSLSPRQQQAIAALYLALAGTLVLRVRSAGQLSSNPLDPAALFRIAMNSAAVFLALRSLWSTPSPRATRNRLPLFAVFFIAYVAVGIAGIAVAVAPLLVVFRLWELGAVVLVAIACYRAFTGDMAPVFDATLRFVWFLVASVAAGVVLAPSAALHQLRGGLFRFRVDGVLPSLSANTVGTLGLVLFAFGLAQPRRRGLRCGVGVLLVVVSQYRTGYVAVAAVLLAWLLSRKRVSATVAAALAVVLAASLVSSAEFREAWYRGESETEVRGLNSRVIFWSEAVDVARRSPIVGTGLSSGTRFEALDRLGHGNVSTIHGTWVEAFVGTGLLGVSLLLLSVALASAAALRRSRDDPLPLLLLVGILVRSLTGTTIELAGVAAIAFLLAGFAASVSARTTSVAADTVEHVEGASA